MNFCLTFGLVCVAALVGVVAHYRRRIRRLSDISNYVEQTTEARRQRLSRDIHDELGGLLVAARMDISWLKQRLKPEEAALEERFTRAQSSLTSAVEFKRRLVEELRPTLLDNMGFFAAVRWRAKAASQKIGASLVESIPVDEMALKPVAALSMFRLIECALDDASSRGSPRQINLTVSNKPGYLEIEIARDAVDGDEIEGLLGEDERLRAAWLEFQVSQLGGTLDHSAGRQRSGVIRMRFPLDKIAAERAGGPIGSKEDV